MRTRSTAGKMIAMSRGNTRHKTVKPRATAQINDWAKVQGPLTSFNKHLNSPAGDVTS